MYFAVVCILLRQYPLFNPIVYSTVFITTMKIINTILFFILSSTSLFAQETKDISRWNVSVANAVHSGQEIDVIFSATIDKDWKLYSSDFKRDIGPLPTEFKFEQDKGYQLVGNIAAIDPLRTVDPTWDVAYTYFLEKAEFRQKIKLLKKDAPVKGTIRGLLCNNKDGICVPFQETFQVN